MYHSASTVVNLANLIFSPLIYSFIFEANPKVSVNIFVTGGSSPKMVFVFQELKGSNSKRTGKSSETRLQVICLLF